MDNRDNRRDFLKNVLLGTAVVTNDTLFSNKAEKIIPYLIPPEEQIPGIPTYIASVCRECPAMCGFVVKNRDGYAIKLEGNPLHPVNQGRLCARGHAALQSLYHPDRISSPLMKNRDGQYEKIGWDRAIGLLTERVNSIKDTGSLEQITFLTSHLSGSLSDLVRRWLKLFGSERHVVYEPFSLSQVTEANNISFDLPEIPEYRIGEADLLVSFGADFLETYVSPVEFSIGFSKRKEFRKNSGKRFVFIAPRLSLTGSGADKWIKIRPGAEYVLALALSREILRERKVSSSNFNAVFYRKLKSYLDPFTIDVAEKSADIDKDTFKRLLHLFKTSKYSMVMGTGVSGQSRNAAINEIAVNILNYLLGNINRTILFGNSHDSSKSLSYRDFMALTKEMEGGKIPLLLVYNSNPYSVLPSELSFEKGLKRVPFIVSFSNFMDKTARSADLILPDHHYLESWGDTGPYLNISGIHQPSMKPLHNTRHIGDTLLSTLDHLKGRGSFNARTFKSYLYNYWESFLSKDNTGSFDSLWTGLLKKGFYNSGKRYKRAILQDRIFSVKPDTDIPRKSIEGFTLISYPSIKHYDGRSQNCSWLQELPDPVTKTVWGSFVEIHPNSGQRLNIKNGDLVRIYKGEKALELPAYYYRGIREDCIAVPLGHGEDGADGPMEILPSLYDEISGSLALLIPSVKITGLNRKSGLVSLEGKKVQGKRDVIQFLALGGLQEKGDSGSLLKERHYNYDMYPPHDHPVYRFGMAIDLNKCIGCSACVVACYAENNIPVVGRDECRKGRELSWIKIERYFEGTMDDPKPAFIPMLCQHCDNAPCETVCPVHATYHNQDGLNIQIYNRCVGTRYCSNNCTYKVRRFNWKSYKWEEPLDKQLNPDLSVRSVGIMEKCTFCIQRIRDAKDLAKDRGEKVKDGDITPACAQTCPSGAIVFGNLKDPVSRVSKLSRDPRGYKVFEEVNTKPSVTYLKKVYIPWSI